MADPLLSLGRHAPQPGLAPRENSHQAERLATVGLHAGRWAASSCPAAGSRGAAGGDGGTTCGGTWGSVKQRVCVQLRGVVWSAGHVGRRGAGGGRPGATLPCRFLVVFNPLEQERLSVVPVLVDSPHVRVLSEEGQPLPAQLTAQWGSATNVVPDVYQVWGAPPPTAAPSSPCTARVCQPPTLTR